MALPTGKLVTGVVLGAPGFWMLPGLGHYLRTGTVPVMGQGLALAVACEFDAQPSNP